MSRGHEGWGTKSEIEYLIRDCGYGREVPRLPRIQHLKRYRDMIQHRKDWGAIDRGKVLVAVNDLISKESQGGKSERIIR